MRSRPIARRFLAALLAAAVALPIAVCVLVALGRLLAAMGDVGGAAVLDWIALAIGAVWVLDLVCLVLAQAVNSLADQDDPPEPE